MGALSILVLGFFLDIVASIFVTLFALRKFRAGGSKRPGLLGALVFVGCFAIILFILLMVVSQMPLER